jgi:predicted amidohydrolase
LFAHLFTPAGTYNRSKTSSDSVVKNALQIVDLRGIFVIGQVDYGSGVFSPMTKFSSNPDFHGT